MSSPLSTIFVHIRIFISPRANLSMVSSSCLEYCCHRDQLEGENNILKHTLKEFVRTPIYMYMAQYKLHHEPFRNRARAEMLSNKLTSGHESIMTIFESHTTVGHKKLAHTNFQPHAYKSKYLKLTQKKLFITVQIRYEQRC